MYGFAQMENLSRTNVSEWINNKRPLFITGFSDRLEYGNNVPQIFSAITSNMQGYRTNNNFKSASYVILFHENELLLSPIGYKTTIYPIKYLNDTIVICTKNPKKGNNYFDIGSYDLEDLVLFSLTAIDREEVSSQPYEFNSQYIKRLFYTLQYSVNISVGNDYSCIVKDLLNQYNWSDEFIKQDIYNENLESFNQYAAKNLNNEYPSTYEEYFLDYRVKFNDYSFDKNEFPIQFGELVNFSSSLLAYNFDINLSINESFKKIDNSLFHYLENDNFDNLFNKLDKANNEYFNYDEYYLPMSVSDARNLLTKFNDQRVTTIRFYISPIDNKVFEKKQLCSGDSRYFSPVPFKIIKYIIY